MNAQDIAGLRRQQLFLMSFEDSEKLKACLDEKGEITVTLDVSSRVMRDVLLIIFSGRFRADDRIE